MKTTSKLVISLLVLGLSGGAFAETAQTQPGASHGPSSAKNAGGHSQDDTSGGPTGGQSGVGGAANGTSGAGKGTMQGSGGMQPRLNGGNGSGPTSPSTTNGGAQGL